MLRLVYYRDENIERYSAKEKDTYIHIMYFLPLLLARKAVCRAELKVRNVYCVAWMTSLRYVQLNLM